MSALCECGHEATSHFNSGCLGPERTGVPFCSCVHTFAEVTLRAEHAKALEHLAEADKSLDELTFDLTKTEQARDKALEAVRVLREALQPFVPIGVPYECDCWFSYQQTKAAVDALAMTAWVLK